MPAALEKTYDGIIIGAGHHGLVLGSYLARCRARHPAGRPPPASMAAGCRPRRSLQPGFYHNLHSIDHFHITETPWFKDLNLSERVSYITPRYELGQPHLDGSALVFGRDLEETPGQRRALLQEGCADLPRVEPPRGGDHLAVFSCPQRLSEPLPQAEREALLSHSTMGRDLLAVTQRQPFDVVKELFENEHVQLLFLFKVSLFGTWLVDTCRARARWAR